MKPEPRTLRRARSASTSKPALAGRRGSRSNSRGDDGAGDRRDRIGFLTELIRGRREHPKDSARNQPRDEGRRFGSKLHGVLRMQEADEDDVIQDAAEALLRTSEPIESLQGWFNETAK